MVEVPVHIRRLVSDRGFTRLRPAGGGVEFQVFAARPRTAQRSTGCWRSTNACAKRWPTELGASA